MSVIRLTPWHLLNGLQRATREAASEAAEWTPSVDVHETADAFVLTADVPGVNPTEIQVTIDNNLLTIQGARANETQSERDGYQRVERVSGKFLRRFTLPDTVDADAVTAKSNHGVLTLTIPKRAEIQPRKIEIQAA